SLFYSAATRSSKKSSTCSTALCAGSAWRSESAFIPASFHQNTLKSLPPALDHYLWAIIFRHVARACPGLTQKPFARHSLADAAKPSTSYAPLIPSAIRNLPARFLCTCEKEAS